MDQWDFASGTLLPGESVVVVQPHVRLYNGEDKIQTKIDTGRLTLTTHRLLWETTILKASLNLSLVSKLDKESKGFTSVFSGKSPKIIVHVTLQGSTSAAASPFTNATQVTYFKLGFTQGGFDEFLGKISDTIRQRNWEKKIMKPEPKRRLGILGIERDIKDEANKTDQQISEAFQDLKSLVEMAKPMVNLAKNISDRASARPKAGVGGSTGDSDETIKFRKQLLSLGIADPVTKESYTSKDEYHLHLAMEICTALDKIVLDAGGIMTLVEAYCRLNRARGVHLISPNDLARACLVLQRAPNSTLCLREFDSKVKVLQHISYDDDIVLGQILSLIEERGSLSPEEYANSTEIPLFVAKQGLLMAESKEKLCRDDHVEGLRFYINIFLNSDDIGDSL